MEPFFYIFVIIQTEGYLWLCVSYSVTKFSTTYIFTTNEHKGHKERI
jgi:hypothetical protein